MSYPKIPLKIFEKVSFEASWNFRQVKPIFQIISTTIYRSFSNIDNVLRFG